MIGRLRGQIAETGEDWVLIDVGGVGYEVFCSSRTLARLPAPGEAATLAIETHVREDQIKLFGFADLLEREWFRLLQSVQGVGAKVALAIMSILTTDELSRAITFQDKAAVGRASGVGPKLAQRIVTELKDKVPTGGFIQAAGSEVGAQVPSPANDAGAQMDAVSALVNLGYAQTQAVGAVQEAVGLLGEKASLDEVIREGLKSLAQ